jgi:ClpP class serine protease
VTGVPELAAKIRQWSATKPIHAFSDGLMASAAYWLAAGCASISCTRSADVGSIGVYMALIDESENWKKEGYRMVLIKAGTRKAEGIAGLPVSDAAIRAWQTEVDAIYKMFTSDIRLTRAAVAASAMQGQCFMGDAAAAAGLVDRVVADLRAAVEHKAASHHKVKTPTAAAAAPTPPAAATTRARSSVPAAATAAATPQPPKPASVAAAPTRQASASPLAASKPDFSALSGAVRIEAGMAWAASQDSKLPPDVRAVAAARAQHFAAVAQLRRSSLRT